MVKTISVNTVRTEFGRTIRKWMRRQRVAVLSVISHYGVKMPKRKNRHLAPARSYPF
jgi:hypothetical protein